MQGGVHKKWNVYNPIRPAFEDYIKGRHWADSVNPWKVSSILFWAIFFTPNQRFLLRKKKRHQSFHHPPNFTYRTERLQNSLKMTVIHNHEFTYVFEASLLLNKIRNWRKCLGWGRFCPMLALIGLSATLWIRLRVREGYYKSSRT